MKEIVQVTLANPAVIQARHCKPLTAKASSSRRLWKVKERDFPVENPKGLELQKGDYIEIEIPAKEAVKSAFLLFILPLVSFLLGYFIFAFLGSLLQALVALALMIGGFLVPFLLHRLGRKEMLPLILTKLSLEEAREGLNCNMGCPGCGGCG
ncbi:MAG: SoxR reducing system RseC family protein [Spirochaetaceae bacterium]|jgi:positive regulator of sigma E activity|nr:SoxR reducing system RseC family protein [Spirochaetaceae bacterium]